MFRTPVKKGRSGVKAIWWSIACCGWAALQLAIAWEVDRQAQGPIDCVSYERAAEKIDSGESPYATTAENLAIWRSYHRLEDRLRANGSPAGDPGLLSQQASPPVNPGPYLYPPTLALLIAETGVGALGFISLILLSVLGFGWIWFKATGIRGTWLLLILLSWDVFAATAGGNVELVLLGATMAAARLLWSPVPWLAAPLIAFVILVKPFYALFFAAFLLILVSSRPIGLRVRLASFAATAFFAMTLIGVEAIRWSPVLRAETLDFMANGLAHQWFVLPVAEQTPMSIWNRTPMQGLVNAGVAPGLALRSAFSLWLALTGWTIWSVRGRLLTFSQVFALAFVLLYLGRPVGWTLNYLELIVLSALWPTAGMRMKRALLVAASVLMASHWSALVLTASGETLALLTLQTAAVPWETWSVVLLSWLVLMWSVQRRTGATQAILRK